MGLTLPKALVFVSFLFLLVPYSPFQSAFAQEFPAVYVDPLSTGPIYPSSVPSTFMINVRLNLLAGQTISGFDVRINYTNPDMVVRAKSVDFSANIFAAKQNITLLECIDDVPILGNNCGNENLGQVHVNEATLVSGGIPGPISGGLLFSVQFSVKGNGTSVFAVDMANIATIIQTPAGPNPQFLQVLTRGGVFGNSGVAAFFNFEPSSPPPPSILPGQPATFDATGSFDNASLPITSYAWDFGDVTQKNVTGSPPNPVLQHTFQLPGNYSVELKVAATPGHLGSIVRTVKVVPALGHLSLTVRDQSGTPLRGNVLVQLFNSSFSPSPIFSRTSNDNASVLFRNLSPGSYLVKFSGRDLDGNQTRTESVLAGWTSQDTVYLTVRVPPPNYADIVFVGSMLGAVGTLAGAILWKKRSNGRAQAARGSRQGRAKGALKKDR